MPRPVTVAILATLIAVPALAADEVFTIDPAHAKVAFHLAATGHDVDGTFAAPSGAIHFDRSAGTAAGEVRLDLHGGQSGNAKRDRQMHRDVLETEKYPIASFRPQKLRGTLAASGTSEIVLEGTMSLHGADHPMALPAKVTIEAGRMTVVSDFDVPFIDWGLDDPSWFVLLVAKNVKVHLEVEGTLTAGLAAAN